MELFAKLFREKMAASSGPRRPSSLLGAGGEQEENRRPLRMNRRVGPRNALRGHGPSRPSPVLRSCPSCGARADYRRSVTASTIRRCSSRRTRPKDFALREADEVNFLLLASCSQ